VKSAVFHPKARDAIRSFPEDVRREFGKVIFDLQKARNSQCHYRDRCHQSRQVLRNCVSGTAPALIESSITRGCQIQFLIFHAFAKKTQKTPAHEIALAQKRLKEMLDEEG